MAMADDLIDIVVPVWNRPVETRACLVALIERTPNIRLVIVDNSSDRETERMLEEIAEALEDKALLLKNRANEGFVRAVNRGLERSESRYTALVRHNSVVCAGWLQPLLAFARATPDAGIVSPTFSGPVPSRERPLRSMEAGCGDFAALLLDMRLFEAVGGFNENWDGASWCLKEYSRRAMRAGFRTFVVPESLVERREDALLGSPVRRAELEQRVEAEYRSVWGSERGYCLHVSKGAELTSFRGMFPVILSGVRQGNMVTVLVHPRHSRELQAAGISRVHSDLKIRFLPRLMAGKAVKNELARLAAAGLPLQMLTWSGDGLFAESGEAITFSEFEKSVRDIERGVYGRDLAASRIEEGV